MTTSSAATVWQRGRLDDRMGQRQLLFGRMYEDASIELSAFALGSRVLCIASAGCTAMKLVPYHEVVAVDVNPVQLAYARKRMTGGPSVRGKVERVMAVARRFGPLAHWWPARVRAFLALDDPHEQMAYWQHQLNTQRFRIAFDAMLSAAMLRRVYASSLLAALPKRLGAVMRTRMERCFARHPNRSNPYARALLLGELATEPPPNQARAVEFVHADVASFLESQPPASFDGFTLSNILDGVDDRYRQRLFAAVKRTAAPYAVTVLRSFRETDAHCAANRASDDRAMLWGSVLVRPASEL